MAKLTRKMALAAIRAAGAIDDRQAYVRLYVENRISYEAAQMAFLEGKRFAAAIAKRDAAAAV